MLLIERGAKLAKSWSFQALSAESPGLFSPPGSGLGSSGASQSCLACSPPPASSGVLPSSLSPSRPRGLPGLGNQTGHLLIPSLLSLALS